MPSSWSRAARASSPKTKFSRRCSRGTRRSSRCSTIRKRSSGRSARPSGRCLSSSRTRTCSWASRLWRATKSWARWPSARSSNATRSWTRSSARSSTRRQVPFIEPDKNLLQGIEALARDKILGAMAIGEKLERYKKLDEIKREVIDEAAQQFPEREKDIKASFDELKKKYFRQQIVNDRRRIDGRGLKDIRPITCEVEVLPRTHGSALYTRGETQALVVATLGTTSDEQKIDALIGEHYKKFMLHYNFPPFSVGEVKFLRGPSRREIGHGNLAERALL